LPELVSIEINHGDVIGFAHQTLGNCGTDLPGAEYYYIHTNRLSII
jgi:hypothetical protein